MRSSKTADIDQKDVEDQDNGVEDYLKHLGWETADLGMDLDALDNCKLRRISRSGLSRVRQESQKQQMNRFQNFWGWDLLIDMRVGLSQFG